jgi:uncharacterized protein
VRQLRRKMRERGDSLMTSAMTVGEVLVKPTRDGDEALKKRHLALFSQPEITVLPFDLEAADAYSRIRQDRSIRPADAIQLACAASAGVQLFITNDDRLSRTNVAGIDFITSLKRAPL